MTDGRETANKASSTTVPLLCLLGVVVLLSSVTLVTKYVFQHSPVQAMSLAMIRVSIGFVFSLLLPCSGIGEAWSLLASGTLCI